MHHPTDRIVRTTTLFIPVVEHWLEREIGQWFHRQASSHGERTVYETDDEPALTNGQIISTMDRSLARSIDGDAAPTQQVNSTRH